MDIQGYFIPIELIYILGIICSILILCSSVFWALSLNKPSALYSELILRTNSWWGIFIGVAIVTAAPAIIGTIIIGYISFVALREMLSIGRFREADRTAIFIAYFAIPVQYFLAYNMLYYQFLYFIPLIMFIGLPFILVVTGNTEMIGRSMSMIPSVLILTVYMISHIVLLFNLNDTGISSGPGGLIIYLIMITCFNDVFQFTWGKLLGKRKILPTVSPNKTWEGFIGGIFTTALLSYLLRFLTPLTVSESLIMGFTLGIMGFIGDAVVSAIKRDLSLKDTDDLIPGHGGAMDRLDSIFITAPVFYHLLRFFIER